MPIPRDLFDEGIDEIDQAIIDFLSESPDEAFSVDELADELVILLGMEFASTVNMTRFMARLEDLADDKHVESRNIHGVRYYSIV